MEKKNFFSILKMTILLIISCSLLTKTNAEETNIKIDESILDGMVNAIKIRNYDAEINHLKETTDLTYLVYYYKKTSNNSLFGGYYLSKIDKKLDYIAMILLVDCDLVVPKNISHCNVKNDNHLPKIKLLVPPIMRFDSHTKKMNSHYEVEFNEENVSEEILYNFIIKNIPAYLTKLNDESYETFMNQPLFNKIILFTDKQTTPNLFKGLSNLFYDRILFGEVQSTNSKFIEKFNIDKFPSIVAIENPFLFNDEHTIHHFEGNTTGEEIVKFIEKFALKQKNYVQRVSDMKLEKNPFVKLNSENIDSFFATNKTKIVYFAGDEINENKIPQDYQRFAQTTAGYFEFGIFSCKGLKAFCKSEFYVDVDKLPSLYVFNFESDYYSMMKNNRLLPASYNKLLVYFAQRIKGTMKKINTNEDVYEVISEDRANGKYPIIYFHKNETKINFPMRLASSIPEITDRVSFYHFDDPSEDLLEIFKVQYTDPFTLLFIHDKLRDDSFRIHKFGENFKNTFLNLKVFLEAIVGDYSYKLKPNQFEINKALSKPDNLANLDEKSVFYKKCIYDSKYCAITFLNGDYDKEIKRTNLQFRDNLKIIKEISEEKNLASINTGLYYVNGTCFDELSHTFKVSVSHMPSIVVFDPQNKVYSKMNFKEFTKENIEKFLVEASSRKIMFRNLDGEIDYKQKNCHEKITKSKEVDYDKLYRIKNGLEDAEDEEEENNVKRDL